MMRSRFALFGLFGTALVILATLLVAVPAAANAADGPERIPQQIRDRANQGPVRVLVELSLPGGSHTPEGHLPSPAVAAQRSDIAAVQQRILSRLRGRSHRVLHTYRTVPYLALEVGADALAELEAAGDVNRVLEDRLVRPLLAQSVPLIGADVAWDNGITGTGILVAVIDTGVDKDHPFLAGKVEEEACYSSRPGAGGDCPNGQETQIGPGAGVPCTFDPFACSHGTHVAGIAAGSGTSFSGVAKGAKLIAIQVFHGSTTECIPFFEPVPCARAFESDIGAGLEHVYELSTQYPIAAANLSLGGGSFTSYCDSEVPQFTAHVANLRSVGIATVVAAGNDGDPAALSFPACISSAVSVGATTKSDQIASFSNNASFLSLLAPGESINSCVPGGGFEVFDGTSMAAPHVSGAWALMKQATPGGSVDDILVQLQQTGKPLTDSRGEIPITKPRISMVGALGLTYPPPVLTSIAPSTVTAWGPAFTLTVTGQNFAGASVVRVNGADRETTFVNATTLEALIPASVIATSGSSLSITVFTPAPGGGTSSPVTLTLTQPALAVSATSVPAGGQVTVTLTNGPGNTYDWLALAATSAPNTSYLQYVYVGAGVTTRTWTVTVPATGGTYEFRLFPDNGYTRAATSPTVTVAAPAPPGLTVSATSVPAGGQVTVTLTNGLGGAYDWLAFAASGAANTSYLQYIYVGAGVTTRTWTVTAPATGGTYEFRLFLNNGYTRAATSPPVTVAAPASPALTVSATSVPAGGQVTVTLTNGLGGAQDWLAFAATGAANTSYLQYIYVGAGVTTRTWTVTAPATGGTYEFRLFLNNGYTRAATSPPVTVAAGSPTLTVSATTVLTGGQVTVTLTNGLGGAQDWLTFAATGAANTSYLQYIYVGAGVTTRTWTVTAPATGGTYEFRLFLNNGYTRAATSPPVTVAAPASPALTVSATSVPAGGQVTVTLTNGLGGAQDWLAFAATGAANTSYLQYIYVGAGVTTRTWTVTAPSTPGTYEFRLFLNNGYTRAATSPPVTVSP